MATAATFDAKRLIPQRLENLGISTRFFAELVGSSQSEVSKFLNDKPLGGERTIEWKKMLDDLEHVASMFDVCGGVGFRNPKQVLRLIEACKSRPEAATKFRDAMSSLMESGLSALGGFEEKQNERNTEPANAV